MLFTESGAGSAMADGSETAKLYEEQRRLEELLDDPVTADSESGTGTEAVWTGPLCPDELLESEPEIEESVKSGTGNSVANASYSVPPVAAAAAAAAATLAASELTRRESENAKDSVQISNSIARSSANNLSMEGVSSATHSGNPPNEYFFIKNAQNIQHRPKVLCGGRPLHSVTAAHSLRWETQGKIFVI